MIVEQVVGLAERNSVGEFQAELLVELLALKSQTRRIELAFGEVKLVALARQQRRTYGKKLAVCIVVLCMNEQNYLITKYKNKNIR